LPGDGQRARLRLFVAVELPDRVREALIEWQRSVLPGRPALRGVNAAGLHITLCFLGSRPSSELEAIESVLLELREFSAPPRLQLGDALWLPARRPRVLAVQLDDAEQALTRVQAALAQKLTEAYGYEQEQRAFSPHVTLARVRARDRVAPERLAPLPALEFDASTIALYRSRLGADGARYEPLATVRLRHSPPADAPAAR
jgi:2'-5' RNA ligase